jgi:hypothetical protein
MAANLASGAAGAAIGATERGFDWLTTSSAEQMAKTLLKVGAGLVIGGFGMGTLGYFSKAAATAAMNNETQVIGNIGAIFSNIKSPTFTPSATGTAPLSPSVQGIQNFFGNAWSDVQAAAGDVAQIGGIMGTLGEDVADGFIDIAKALLAFVMHFPDILWNGLVWGVGGAVADLLNWIFPWVVLIGAACIVIGTVILLASRIWGAVAKPAWDRSSGKWASRQEAKMEAGFDRLFGNFNHTVAEPVAPAPILPIARPEAPPPSEEFPKKPVKEQEPAPEAVGQTVDAETVVETAPEVVTPAPPPENAPTTPPVEPPSGVMTQKEAETYLGDRPNRAPTREEMQAMIDESERNREASMPKKTKGVSGYDESRRAAEAFAAEEATSDPAPD